MKTFATIRGLFATTLVTLVVVASLTGCGENPISSVSFGEEISENSQLTDAVNATSGQVLFQNAQSSAILTLSLSEISALTPYLSGEKTIETASLAEIAAITPAVVKFQNAFNAELAAMSIGEVNRVLQYMETMDMNKFPYPVPEDASKASRPAA